MSERNLCNSCDCELTSADYEAGECTQCGGLITVQRSDDVLPEIVKRAMTETVTDLGQLSKPEIYQLNKYVKRGWLSKGKGGPFPILKTVYARPGYNFEAWRLRRARDKTGRT